MNARKAVRHAAVVQRRQDLESGSAVITGIPVWIDNVSQAKLAGAASLAARMPDISIDWKGSDGQSYPLDAAQIDALSMAVGLHIQALFSHEATLTGQIAAAETLDDLDLIDIAGGWPGQET
ncbi:DUF4376 domain-containing protein [Haematobacter massiliensis]|uniref:DUF4376 domain-containing protein n=1 Tax=Haematobacter massiliensis TaxID=195105 RepID=UPI0023F5088D|nr:DUF4376 domain-containing protein [Haematobacter massiliensis]